MDTVVKPRYDIVTGLPRSFQSLAMTINTLQE
ncbi:MAG TPA: hypothetical protein LFW11_03710 [Rickettsia endosymbiont of Proechinophthirus fluctus]|nr:hypothetical protein [Rickettsia endosymbiont of Proechinophthirus fluctus]